MEFKRFKIKGKLVQEFEMTIDHETEAQALEFVKRASLRELKRWYGIEIEPVTIQPTFAEEIAK